MRSNDWRQLQHVAQFALHAATPRANEIMILSRCGNGCHPRDWLSPRSEDPVCTIEFPENDS